MPSARRWFPTTALGLLLGVLLAGRLPASSLILLSEDQLVDNATLVVWASVLSVDVHHRLTTIPPVQTTATLQIQEVLKGTAPSGVIAVDLPGGKFGDLEYQVPGTPRFRIGEEVCVFLRPRPGGNYLVAGMHQGKYRLVTDVMTGLTVAVRDGAHSNLIPRPLPGQTQAQAIRSAAPHLDDWGSFRSRIRARAQGGR